MAPSKKRTHADEFAELVDSAPKDFDPEADSHLNSDDEDESDSQSDGAREHYVDVGKSKLRKPKDVALGPQYRGSRVSRDAVHGDEDEDDPFSKDFDGDSSDEMVSEDSVGDSAEDSEDAIEEDANDEDLEAQSSSETSEDGEDEAATEAIASRRNLVDETNRAEVKKMMAEEQKAVAATVTEATRADAVKGRAVKRQRAAFDSLLNTRIKLQKTLIASNTLVALNPDDLERQRQEADEAIEAAELAAFNLWSSLNSFRDNLLDARAGSKRKRPHFSSKTQTAKLWQHMQSQEESSIPHRNATLQRWSVKARGATVLPTRSKLNNAATEATIVDVLNEHLSTPDRLLKRAHTPRSCAPMQLAQKVTEDTKIYDDADFYGLLLKELLEQKSVDSAATANLVDMDFSRMRREAKTKRNVDTKASKGRKLRYTVHEKLQNLMAPEDRGTWGERQTDELFGSLFGQRMGLGEDKEDANMQDGEEDEADAEAGLLMFRS